MRMASRSLSARSSCISAHLGHMRKPALAAGSRASRRLVRCRDVATQIGEVALAALLAPCGQTRKVVLPQRVARVADLRAHADEERLLDLLADRLALLVEVQALDQ